MNSLSRSAGDEVRPLTDSLNALCEKLGESKKQTNSLALAFDLLGAAADIIEIVGFLNKIERMRRLFKRIIEIANIARLAIAGFGVAVGAAAVAAAPYIAALAVLAGGAFLFERALTRSARAQDDINEAIARGNTLLEEASKLSGGERVAKNAEARKEFQDALATNQKELERARAQKKRKENLLKSFPEIDEDPLAKPEDGVRDRARREIEGNQKILRALIEKVDQLETQRGEIQQRIKFIDEDDQKFGAPREQGQASGAFPEDAGLAAQLEEDRLTAEEFERNLAALQERLDPLGAATLAYKADLKLLEKAQKDGLITEARSLELKDKLKQSTMDARDPVAALRQKLEAERNQIMMTDDEREISNRLLEIEARLKTAGVNVSDEVKQSLERELIAIQNLRKGREAANEAQKKADADLEKRQQDTEEKMKRRAEAVDEVFGDIRDAAKDSIKDVIKGTESIGDAFQKLADRITDILLDLALEELLSGGTGFTDVFGTIFGGIGDIFGSAPANLAGPAGIGILPIGRQGGVIGQDRFPVRRFHDGGFPGLRPNEVPIIAQRGEEILARGDPRNAANGSPGSGGGVVVNVTFPNARNTDEARQAGSEIAAKAAAAAQRGMARKGIG